jgi:hypothetical protein
MNSDTGIIAVEIELIGIGTMGGEIIRHITPLTADIIIEKLPLNRRGRFGFGAKNYWTLPGMGIHKGPNQKSLRDVEKGDIIYNPKTDELIILIENMQMPNKVNKVGKVNSNLEILLNGRNGLNTRISKKS